MLSILTKMAGRRRPFDTVCDIFKSKNCCLYTTKEEYESMKSPSYQRLKFRASCGHDNDAVLDGFIFKETGVICKFCTTEKVILTLQKLNLSDNHPGFEQEYKGYLIIKNILQEEFDIMQTNEGCLADVIIKPKYEIENKWALIQMKSTHGVYRKDGYKFGFKEKSYDNMIIICISIEDERIWVMDWTRVRNSSGICIGLTKKAKYYDAEVTHENLPKIIHELYTKSNKYNKEHANIPITSEQLTEHRYRVIRETNISYLEYKYSKIQNYKVDYYINDYKIQEKVAYFDIKTYAFCMKKKVSGIDVCYDKSDNDFYWIWVKDTDIFYIFPEDILIKKNLIQVDGNLDNKQKLVHMGIDFKQWAYNYKYELSDNDLEIKLKSLFKLI
jgi:hypothetical protein